MKTIIHGIVFAWICAFWAGFASAETFTYWGKVTGSKEMYQTRVVTVPEQTCRIVDVPVYGNVGGGASTGDVLTGAIIGGIIGNNIKGETGGGAAGAVIGGILGAEKGKNKQGIVGYKQQQECTTINHQTQEQVVVGYKVSYEVLGMEGTVIRANRPATGSDIRVTVQISAR